MDVIYRLRIDNPADARLRRFSLRRDVPYLHVPRIREAVVLSVCGSDSEDLGARRVTDVMYTLSGGIVLDFSLDGLVNDAEAQVDVIRNAGYTEIL